jgi:hypothetical protein
LGHVLVELWTWNGVEYEERFQRAETEHLNIAGETWGDEGRIAVCEVQYAPLAQHDV